MFAILIPFIFSRFDITVSTLLSSKFGRRLALPAHKGAGKITRFQKANFHGNITYTKIAVEQILFGELPAYFSTNFLKRELLL